jgi:hypothetical protein
MCDNGYFEMNGTCLPCSIGCLNCVSLFDCSACNVSAFFRLVNSTC